MLSYTIRIYIKGSKMSKLDLEVQEHTLVAINELHQDLIDINIKSIHEVDENMLEEWRAVFEEDKVQVLEVCC